MSDRVALNAAHVVRILCENHGSLVLSELQRKICQEFKTKDGNEDELKRITSDERNFLIKEDLVVAKTSVRVCGNFKIKDGNEDVRVFEYPGHENCDKLHLCKYHVCGNCSHRNCISHDLSCHNNQDLLMRMHLQYLTEANLFQLLLQNDPELLPEVCQYYNMPSPCKYNSKCEKIHICKEFLQGNCSNGGACRLDHDFGTQSLNALENRGVSTKEKSILIKTYKNRLLLLPPEHEGRSVCPSGTREICIYNLLQKCRYSDKCFNIHHDLPYRWQILGENCSTWSDVAGQEDIERDFCNPANNTSLGSPPVDFVDMTRGQFRVSHLPFATQWRWCYVDPAGNWMDYSEEETATLEAAYLKHEEYVTFEKNGNKHSICLKQL
ncbi:protein mono-ADP-ribosyltransferase PARP12-like [Denticeps clupeoides]|uniref:protein mono-ADP-ribosyltransferase PARP12-like n=1 Tax=Denticeps clupeoides TaxID=299321 RepID=UPI0010A57E02|nr:protein mono-ADP-ribosyltransferase PARP12-like [Denticeps clupeoides]